MSDRQKSNERTRGRVDGTGKQGKTKGSGSRGARLLKKKVKTARGRKLSSTLWLERQLNDPFVAAAKKAGYRSRAAFKLIDLDDRFGFLRPESRVVDLGAAPGGWSQVVVQRISGKSSPSGEGQGVLAIDVQDMDSIAGVSFLQLDFMSPGAADLVRDHLGGPVDVVLSDMAAPATGHKQTDHLRIIALCEAALDFGIEVLKPGGHFVAKVLQGGTERDLLSRMKKSFQTVRHVKPKASRADSAEIYVVAQGFRPPQA